MCRLTHLLVRRNPLKGFRCSLRDVVEPCIHLIELETHDNTFLIHGLKMNLRRAENVTKLGQTLGAKVNAARLH